MKLLCRIVTIYCVITDQIFASSNVSTASPTPFLPTTSSQLVPSSRPTIYEDFDNEIPADSNLTNSTLPTLNPLPTSTSDTLAPSITNTTNNNKTEIDIEIHDRRKRRVRFWAALCLLVAFLIVAAGFALRK
eukprot:Awhi_evm1s833